MRDDAAASCGIPGRRECSMIATIECSELAIPFKAAFKHASAQRSVTQSIWVTARSRDGQAGYGEGCPREYVTGEGLASARAFVAAHHDEWLAAIHDTDGLSAWIASHREEIDANPAAWAAVELALLDLFGKQRGRSVESLLGLPEISGMFRYTAVLGDAPPHQFEAQLTRYQHAGFGDFKIKLSGDPERDRAKVGALLAMGVPPASVRADANNLWPDSGAAARHLQSLNYPFFALEEPLKAGDLAGMSTLSTATGARIILDESCSRLDQLSTIEIGSGRWIVNLRVSKMGGLIRSLEIVEELRRREMPLIIGAHVGETSVLTRAALTVAMAARDILLAQEGAFGTHLLAHDVVESSLMFGAGGTLNVDQLPIGGTPGLGLDMAMGLIVSAVR